MEEGSRIKTRPDIPWSPGASAQASGPNGERSGPDFRAGAQGADEGREPYQWADPQLLEDYLSPVLPLRPEMMPEPLGDWVADVAYRVRCPLDFVTVSAVVMTGAVCAARVRIRPGHNATWEIAPNLWVASSDPPGPRKLRQPPKSLKCSHAWKLRRVTITRRAWLSTKRLLQSTTPNSKH
jgi:hypothetical protein